MDSRAFVNKFVNDQACFIAYHGTMMQNDADLKVVETWVLEDDKRELELKEVQYSQKKAAEYIYKQIETPSIMHGPDMYHVYLDDVLQVALWQPMSLPECVELIDITTSGQPAQLLKVGVDAIKRIIMELIEKKFAQKIHLKEGSSDKFKIVL